MNERIEKLAVECYLAPEFDYKKFAELVELDCVDKFIKVWYEQGLDIRGADLNKFMLRLAELNDEQTN